MIDWANWSKIRINNYTDAFVKHEIVKLVIVKNILEKYHSKKMYQEIYTEHKFNGKTCDVFHRNNLTKEEVCYEVQSLVSKDWIQKTSKFYEEKNLFWVLIDLNQISDNINELNNQVKLLII